MQAKRQKNVFHLKTYIHTCIYTHTLKQMKLELKFIC